MSNFDFDGFSEGDWDERNELAWNEFDWEHYLRSQDETLRRYLEIYSRMKGRPDRLDRTARMMGWDIEEWTGNEFLDDEEDDLDLEDENEDLEPYTLHKHPIYIATKALYLDIQARWLDLLSTGRVAFPPTVAAAYQASLSVGENNAISAIYALDMGDFAMSVCQFKRALADLNRSFQLLDRIDRVQSDLVDQYRQEATVRLFDLREIWLRVMQYSREEVKRRSNGDD